MRKRIKKKVTLLCYVMCLFCFSFFSFSFDFFLLLSLLCFGGGQRANERYFLFHLHCHVQCAPSTLNLAHTDKLKTHFNHFSRTLFGTFLFIQLQTIILLFVWFATRSKQRMQQHIQFQFCLLSIFFEFAVIFFFFSSTTAIRFIFRCKIYQICIDC